MKKRLHQTTSGLIALVLMVFLLVACDEDVDQYPLTVFAYPENVAEVMGDGRYEAGESILVSAEILSEEYGLVNWIDAEGEHVSDDLVFEFTMPNRSDTLTANFSVNHKVEGEGVTDTQGNNYKTIVLGDQEWMAENLRVSVYQDGSPIQADLSDDEWTSTSDGAYAIFDPEHEAAEGIDSHDEMDAAYGKLYNWHAVSDEREICPEGWRMPTKNDWLDLITYIEEEYHIYNVNETDGLGNALKSAFQVNHPWGAEYAKDLHPRWNAHIRHYGIDVFGFSASPGGYREYDGRFLLLGYPAFFWSSTEWDDAYAHYFYINANMGSVNQNPRHKELGLSVRCIRQ